MKPDEFFSRYETELSRTTWQEGALRVIAPGVAGRMKQDRLSSLALEYKNRSNLDFSRKMADIQARQQERANYISASKVSLGYDPQTGMKLNGNGGNMRYEAAQSIPGRTWHGGMQLPPESIPYKFDRTRMLMASREAAENDPIFNGILRKYEVYIAGIVHYQPETGDDDLDKYVSEFINEEWGEDIDVTGRFSIPEMCRLALREEATCGQCGWIWVNCPDGVLRQLMVEGDRIGAPYYAQTGNQWVDGIELDELGRPINVKIYQRMTQSAQYGNPQDIPWENFIHFFQPRRPEAYNGVPIFGTGALLNILIDIREMREAMQLKVKDAAMLSMIFTTLSGGMPTNSIVGGTGNGFATVNGQNGPRTFAVDKFAKWMALAEGEDVKQLESEFPSQQIVNFMEKELFLTLANHLNLSYGLIRDLGDFKGAGVRAILAQDDREFCLRQKNLERRYLNPTIRRGLYWAASMGMIPGANPNDPELYKGEWFFPERLTVDQGDDAKNDFLLNAAGLKPMKRVYGGRGKSWKKESDQGMDEIAYIIAGCKKREIDLTQFIRVETSVSGRNKPAIPDEIPGDEIPAPIVAPSGTDTAK